MADSRGGSYATFRYAYSGTATTVSANDGKDA
ncbi:hypothetical protein AA0111_g11451 [Alternaria arborescens]|uniref:Uncharacterized protein n=1 Tax=Alternaria tenuissima TaxID=119927 RepID=A0AB37W2I3_9PLEO|nr:hypothetical protein AA0111_g11451 [Alternaria arborescens]RYN16903.1 hypothetical protein AA0115_g12085 [Alternaria tenuissima]RYO16160.1 hypothetical protein AA0111_g11451 [Alternaria arborescens]